MPGVFPSKSFDLLALLDEVIGDAQFEAESLHKCVRYRGGGEPICTAAPIC
ncbi:MAG: hypothetical protein U1E47_05340 [Rivihabitans pingtungensis]